MEVLNLHTQLPVHGMLRYLCRGQGRTNQANMVMPRVRTFAAVPYLAQKFCMIPSRALGWWRVPGMKASANAMVVRQRPCSPLPREWQGHAPAQTQLKTKIQPNMRPCASSCFLCRRTQQCRHISSARGVQQNALLAAAISSIVG